MSLVGSPTRPSGLSHAGLCTSACNVYSSSATSPGELRLRGGRDLGEGDHYGEGVPGQTEKKGTADAAEGHRPSRAHGNLPEQHLAKLRHQRSHEIGLAHRDAAGGDDRIGGGRLAERGFQLRGVVAHHAQVGDFDAETLQHAVQRVAVGIVDLALLERRADRGELIAGGEERDAQLALHAHLAHAERCDQPHFCRPQPLPRLEHWHADLQVLARIAHVLRALLPRRHDDAVAFALHHFLDHHGVAARRHHGTSHDAHALARIHLSCKWSAGQRRANLGERLVEVRATQRIAVHRRVVVRRHVDARHDVLGQHPAQRFPYWYFFMIADRRDARAHRLARLVDVQRVRGVAVEAAHRLKNRDRPHFSHLRKIGSVPISPSSWSVLMLRKASASSSKATSITLSDAYQASILRPPPARNASRLPITDRRTRANTGCGWSPVLATARSLAPRCSRSRATRSEGRNGESQGTVTASGCAMASSPACKPASGPAKPPTRSLTTRWPSAP